MEKITPSGKKEGFESGLDMLLLKGLQELYGAEKHQLLVLPLLKKAAASLKLQNVLANHLDDTKEQISRLEEIFEKLGQSPVEILSESVLGITRAAETAIGSTEKTTATRDAALIVAAQQLEHYEITSYGSVANH